jgi:hypothetical protein
MSAATTMYFQETRGNSYLIQLGGSQANVYRHVPDGDTEAPETGHVDSPSSDWVFAVNRASQVDPPRTFVLLRGVNAAGKTFEPDSQDTLSTITNIEQRITNRNARNGL